jgi:1,2-dihydroxy-3-keto-5-methylthiopentene dioxygenase
MQAIDLSTNQALSAEELRAQGVPYQKLSLDEASYQPALDALRKAHGYIEQDVIELDPETPQLEELLAKFDSEHLHGEDEVRFILRGEGVFDIRSTDDRWMRVKVEAGDLIIVPKGRYHRFELTESKTIVAVRLFQNPSGWVPQYR